MQASTASEHNAEVRARERFEFGKNWRRFLATLNDQRIELAEASLVRFLGQKRLDGQSFLDIGSGSGLFSLCARRLGARVFSFDFDTDSVACTTELRRRYYPNDPDWTVEQASVLDTAYLERLGQFDIVYSWGVLHHTGQMWPALENVKARVKPGGTLFIAIYNELGAVTDEWRRIKKEYNARAPSARLPYALSVIAREEGPDFVDHLRHFRMGAFIDKWRRYDVSSTRGMSKWHDWIDWIGGYPYETATYDEIVDFYNKDGFSLINGVHRVGGYGCNEFVFRKISSAPAADDLVADANVYARRFGRTVGIGAPGEGSIAGALPAHAGEDYFLFEEDRLIGPATVNGEQVTWDASLPVNAGRLRVAPGKLRALAGPFQRSRGNIWAASLPDLAGQADDSGGGRSTLALLHNRRQLRFGHAVHDSIAQYDDGRYSHWGAQLLFSLPKAVSPDASGTQLEIIYRIQP